VSALVVSRHRRCKVLPGGSRDRGLEVGYESSPLTRSIDTVAAPTARQRLPWRNTAAAAGDNGGAGAVPDGSLATLMASGHRADGSVRRDDAPVVADVFASSTHLRWQKSGH
jgi:hypothetical protein